MIFLCPIFALKIGHRNQENVHSMEATWSVSHSSSYNNRHFRAAPGCSVTLWSNVRQDARKSKVSLVTLQALVKIGRVLLSCMNTLLTSEKDVFKEANHYSAFNLKTKGRGKENNVETVLVISFHGYFGFLCRIPFLS